MEPRDLHVLGQLCHVLSVYRPCVNNLHVLTFKRLVCAAGVLIRLRYATRTRVCAPPRVPRSPSSSAAVLAAARQWTLSCHPCWKVRAWLGCGSCPCFDVEHWFWMLMLRYTITVFCCTPAELRTAHTMTLQLVHWSSDLIQCCCPHYGWSFLDNIRHACSSGPP